MVAGAVVALCLHRVPIMKDDVTSVVSSSIEYDNIDDILAWVMSLRDPHSKRQALSRGVDRDVSKSRKYLSLLCMFVIISLSFCFVYRHNEISQVLTDALPYQILRFALH